MRLARDFASRRTLVRRTLAILALLIAASLVAPSVSWGSSRLVSSSGTDAGSCLASACRSFGYAYRQSAPGDVVEVAGGSYPDQSIPVVAGRSGPAVEFRPAAGASVSLGGVDVLGSFVTVRGMRMGWVSVDAGQTPVVGASLVDVVAATMWINNTRDLRVIGGSYGGNFDGPTVQIGGSPASSNLTFDGVDFHDAVATNSTVHMECIWAGGVQGFTVRNSIFRNCAYFDIFFTTLNGPDPKNVLLENNVFEVTKQWNGQNAPYAVNVANWLSRAENFTFRNNTFGGDVAIQPTSIVNMRLTGNVGAVASCKSGVNYSHNVFTGAKCATTDKQVSLALSQFVNPAAHDWRPTFGAAAIDAGNPNDFPMTDRAGLLRNGPPDAGAHEYNGIAPGAGDMQVPSVPGGVSASGGVEQVVLGWQAASDNVGVVRYNVHRSAVAGFAPSAANRVGQPVGAGFTDGGLAAGRYYYRVTAEDAAGNVSAASAEVSALAAAEQTPPSVSVTSPSAGATVSGTATVAASASDNRGVSGVQFKLDGQNLGGEDTSAPYSVAWNTTVTSDGAHTLTAVARDTAGNSAASPGVAVTVSVGAARTKVPPGRAKKKDPVVTDPTLTTAPAPSLTLLDTSVQESGVISLAVRASRRGRVVGTVKRTGSERRARRIRSMTRVVRRGRNRVRFSTRGWSAGSFLVTIRVLDGKRLVSKPVRLRVSVREPGSVRVARVQR
jgi:hypothetical protein